MENLLTLWKAGILILGGGGAAFLFVVHKQKLNRKLRRKAQLPLLAGVGAGFAGFLLSLAFYWLGLL
jgi:hypothetical protein